MKTDSFNKVTIILLLLLNISTLGYLLLNRQHEPGRQGHPPPPPDRIIIERLNLDEQQIRKFDELKHIHHTQILDIQETSGRLHKQLFALLKQETNDNRTKDSLLHLIQAGNLQKEQVTFDHFRELRKILTSGQQAEFDEFVEEISQRIMGPHRRH